MAARNRAMPRRARGATTERGQNRPRVNRTRGKGSTTRGHIFSQSGSLRPGRRTTGSARRNSGMRAVKGSLRNASKRRPQFR
jgi:hypothetical protein